MKHPRQKNPGETSSEKQKTRKLVHERAIAVALSHGRSAQEISPADLEQAQRDLAVEPAFTEPVHQSMAAEEGWDPAPASHGHKVPVPHAEDEDDEGRSEVEQLVEDGVKEARQEQRKAASREGEMIE